MKLFKRKSVIEKRRERFWNKFLEFPFLWSIRSEWTFKDTVIKIEGADITMPKFALVNEEVYVVDDMVLNDDTRVGMKVTKIKGDPGMIFDKAIPVRYHHWIRYLVIVDTGARVPDQRLWEGCNVVAINYLPGLNVTIYKPGKPSEYISRTFFT